MDSKMRRYWIFPPIVVGLIILFILQGNKQELTESDRSEAVRFVRVIEVAERSFTPVTEGYGSVKPAQIWTAISQVSGRVVYMHPRLRDGEIIAQGTELLRIDPVDYELALAQANNELAELAIERSNANASLKIEQRNLVLTEQEFKRRRKLAEEGSLSRSSADEAERAVLGSRALVQNLNNSLALFPTRKSLLQAKVTQAERDLENTHLSAPFNMRVSSLATELHQFAGVGKALFSGDSTDRIEIIAQVSVAELRNLFIGHTELPTDINLLSTNMAEITGFKPLVRLDIGGGQIAEWDAEFLRMSDQVDPQTRTMGVVVAVDFPMQKIIPGQRPPLSKGMFVQVRIAGHAQPNRILIPRSAIRGNQVYLVNAEGRLETRTVTKLYNQQQFSVIADGIQPGELLVVSDLLPAIEGMLLQHEIDSDLQQSLLAAE